MYAAVLSVADNLQALAAAGAHNFLIGNAPNLGLVPAVLEQGGMAPALAEELSLQYNAALDGAVDSLSSMFSLDVAKLNIFALLQSLVDAPQQLGLTDVTDSCITPDVIAHAVCKDPDDYLFWDGIHPTHTVHEFIAQQAFQLVH